MDHDEEHSSDSKNWGASDKHHRSGSRVFWACQSFLVARTVGLHSSFRLVLNARIAAFLFLNLVLDIHIFLREFCVH